MNFSSEIDNEGVIEPDTDDPQEMGDYENLEVNAQYRERSEMSRILCDMISLHYKSILQCADLKAFSSV